MSAGEHEATFEGLTVQAVTMPRTPGLTHDTGWLEFNTEDVKAIAVQQPFRLWSIPGIVEVAGPFTMHAAKQLRQQQAQKFSTTPQEAPPPASGFNRGGTLKMLTHVDGQAIPGVETTNPTLRNIYLAAGGIEEMLQDLALAEKHNENRLRVNVVDIRYFWQDFGLPVYGRYNIVNENGTYDRGTLNPETTKPWTLSELLNYVCLCLPGAPPVSGKVLESITETPVNIDMKMDPPIKWLKYLVDLYRLEPHLSFAGSLWFARRGANHKVQQFARNPGGTAKPLGVKPRVEKKTVYVLDVPEAVTVVGGPRTRRVRHGMDPAFIDEDGRVRALFDIDKLWPGYSEADVFLQAFQSREKQYLNVPGANLKQKSARENIARKYFLKMYVPAWMFLSPTTENILKFWDGTGSYETFKQSLTGGNSEAQFYWPLDLRKNPDLPALDPWVIPGVMNTIRTQTQYPPEPNPKRNLKNEPLITVEPIVWASVIRQTFSADLADLTKRVDAALGELDALKVRYQQDVDRINSHITFFSKSKKKFSEMNLTERVETYIIQPFADTLQALKIPNAQVELKTTGKTQEENLIEKNIVLLNLEAELKATLKRLEKIAQQRAQIVAKTAPTYQVVNEFGFAKMWVQMPWGFVPPGQYSFQKETGILMFNDIAALMSAGACFEPENIDLIGNGSVSMMWDTHLYRGDPGDVSSWTFLRNASGGPPILCEISEESNVKPFIVRDDSLVIHEDETGAVMNIQDVTDKAGELAKAVLSGPTQQDGYYYEYPGFWHVSTDDSVNQVIWTWDGDAAHTRILANNPDMDAGARSLAAKKWREGVSISPAGPGSGMEMMSMQRHSSR